jgi:peptidoglycan endopeptidase LytE
MRKVLLSIVAASSLLVTSTYAKANTYVADSNVTVSSNWTSVNAETTNTYIEVQQVSSSKATAKSGTFKTTYNTNVRADAGTKNKIVTFAKKGSTVTATHQKNVGKEVWYKVNVNGKSGWLLSTLVAPVAKKASVAKAPAKAAAPASTAKTTKFQGTFKTKHNSNIRSAAGTNNRIVTLAKAGTTVKATAQKKVGNATWYQVSANGKIGWISSSLLTSTKAAAAKPTVTKVSEGTSNSSSLIDNALKLRGTPYRFGGATTSGFDCSGFVQYVFKQSGKSMSRSTLTQFAETKTVSTPQPGDLVFFQNTYRPGISHVGIYIGNNQFVHAGGQKAEVKSLSDSYWKTKFHSFKRK